MCTSGICVFTCKRWCQGCCHYMCAVSNEMHLLEHPQCAARRSGCTDHGCRLKQGVLLGVFLYQACAGTPQGAQADGAGEAQGVRPEAARPADLHVQAAPLL